MRKILTAALAALALAMAWACSKSYSPGDFPREDVYEMANGSFFVREDGGTWRRYTAAGEKTPAEWRLDDTQDEWYIVRHGGVVVAIPKDRDPGRFMRMGEADLEWQPYGEATEAWEGARDTDAGDRGDRGRREATLTADDLGLKKNEVPVSVDVYMMAENGDEINLFIVGNNVIVNNLEGWVFGCDQKPAVDGGDHWQYGGPVYWINGMSQARPYLYIAKDWSWVQIEGVDGVFDRFITKEKYERDSRQYRERLMAQGQRPRNPAAEFNDRADRMLQGRLDQQAAEIRAEADALGTGGTGRPSGGGGNSGSSRRDYVRVKEYSPNYTGSGEKVYCEECGYWDYPHTHYNKVR